MIFCILVYIIWLVGIYLYGSEKHVDVSLFLKNIFIIFGAMLSGMALNSMELKPELPTDHFQFLLFFYLAVTILIIQVFECFRYRNNWGEVVKKTSRFYFRLIVIEVFLLSITERLEMIEGVLAITGGILLCMISKVIDGIQDEKHAENEIECIRKDDCPINEENNLFPSRKAQIEALCKELKEFGREPYAVMISGAWGSGKTSFINVLKNKMEDAEFVELEFCTEYDINEVMKEVAAQIERIFKKNKIYIGRNSAISSYFNKINELTGEAGFNGLAKIFKNVFVSEKMSYPEEKRAINQEMDAFYSITKKKIYIVIDNMDRIINDEERVVLFQLIRESVELNNCVTLFVVDYDKLKSEHIGAEFFEKYVNRHIKLYSVEFEEIVDEYAACFLTEAFWEDKSDYIVRYGRTEKEKLIGKTFEVLKNLRDEINESLTNAKEKSKQDINKKQRLRNAETRLSVRLNNPRKVKRFLNSVENLISVADMLWFQHPVSEENEYSEVNWVEIIFYISFLIAFLTEEYDSMIASNDLQHFKEKVCDYYVVSFIEKTFISNNTLNSTYNEVLEKVLYKLYALNPLEVKSRHQKLMEEIEHDSIIEENLAHYINECTGLGTDYQILKKIIKFTETHHFKNIKYRKESVLLITETISRSVFPEKEGYLELCSRVHNLISVCSKEQIFQTQDINVLKSHIERLTKQLVFGKQFTIKTMLEILTNSNLDIFFSNDIMGVVQLYQLVIKVNSSYPIDGFQVTNNRLSTVIDYFRNIHSVFSKPEYHAIYKELSFFMFQINQMLQCLKIWNENELNEQIYNPVIREFDESFYSDYNAFTVGIVEFEKDILLHPNDEDIRILFEEVLQKVEKLITEKEGGLHGYYNEVLCKLDDTYERIDITTGAISGFNEEKWKYAKIRLFRMKKALEAV